MDYEKKYKTLLEQAKEELKACGSLDCDAAKQIFRVFPELAESEDEKIKRCISDAVRKYGVEFATGTITKEKMLAWLEKQGEQKPTADDKKLKKIEKQDTPKDYNSIDPHFGKPIDTKSKFKVGDWIASARGTAHIIGIGVTDSEFLLEYTDGDQESLSIEYVNSTYTKWAIQKAWDGDVLACGDKASDCPFIFHNLTEELNPRSYCGVNTTHQFQVNDENGGSWCCLDDVRPANKEQQDYLFKKMREAGYEWEGHTKKVICK